MKKHVFKYFNQMQLQYNDMLKIAEKVNKEIVEGNVTPEQYDNFETYFNTVKNNYERVAYIMHLLSLPPDFIQKIHTNRLLKEQEKRAKEARATTEDVIVDNKEALEASSSLLEELGDSEDGRIC